MLTIATWNLQKLTPRSGKRKDPIKQKIQEINADIWIFTEVKYGDELASEFLPNYQVTTSQQYADCKSASKCQAAYAVRIASI